MAAHVAHEVRNNLVPVTLYLSLLRRRLTADAPGLEVLAKIAAGFTALDATVNDLLHFTSDRDPHRVNFSPDQLVDELVASLAPAARRPVDSRPPSTCSADNAAVRTIAT